MERALLAAQISTLVLRKKLGLERQGAKKYKGAGNGLSSLPATSRRSSIVTGRTGG
jgi:hypothetical protein